MGSELKFVATPGCRRAEFRMLLLSFQRIKLMLVAARYPGEDLRQERMDDRREEDQSTDEVERFDFNPMHKFIDQARNFTVMIIGKRSGKSRARRSSEMFSSVPGVSNEKRYNGEQKKEDSCEAAICQRR